MPRSTWSNIATFADRRSGTYSLAYDEVGNVLSSVAPDGSVVANNWDSLNRLVSTTDAAGRTTTYTLRRHHYQDRQDFVDAVTEMVEAGESVHLRMRRQYDFLTGRWTYTDRCGEEWLAQHHAFVLEWDQREIESQRRIEEHNAALRDRLNIDRGFLGTMWDGTGGLAMRGIRAAECPSEVQTVVQQLGIGGLGRGGAHLLDGDVDRAVGEALRAVAVTEGGTQVTRALGPVSLARWSVLGAGATAVDAACEFVGVVR